MDGSLPVPNRSIRLVSLGLLLFLLACQASRLTSSPGTAAIRISVPPTRSALGSTLPVPSPSPMTQTSPPTEMPTLTLAPTPAADMHFQIGPTSVSKGALAYSPDGRHLAATTDQGDLEVWQLPEGILVDSWRTTDSTYGLGFPSVQFSPTQTRWLAASVEVSAPEGEPGAVGLWDVEGVYKPRAWPRCPSPPPSSTRGRHATPGH